MTARALLVEHDTTERLGPDDMATLREQQNLAAALRRQAEQASAANGTPGICSNCLAVCLPHTVYCDDDCRQDHEHRVTVQKRQTRTR